MPQANENTAAELDSYVDKLLERASGTGSVSEDDIQIVLKDVEVSDAQLNGLYRSLREQGVEIVSQGDDDSSLGGDDAGVLRDDLDDDEFEDEGRSRR